MTRKILLLIALITSAISVNAQHLTDSEGNIYIEKQIDVVGSFDSIIDSAKEIIEQNELYGGKILSTRDGKLSAQYVFKTIMNPIPLTLDAVAYVSITRNDNLLAVRVTLKDYNKRNSAGGLWVLPIKEAKPINPKGSKFGLTVSQTNKLWSRTLDEANALLTKLENNIK